MAVQGTRKADRVARDLLGRIVAGELAVGSLLPREAELAEAYQVNRSVVREAIKQLEVHRLVQPIKRRGTEVLDPLRSPSADVLAAMLEPRPGVVDRQALEELLEVRATLDAEMTGLAAERHDDDDLRALDRVLDELRRALGQPARYAAQMDELASVLARATHNRIYQMMVHWHQRVRGESDPLQMLVRLANEAHLSGVTFLATLIRERRAEEARAFVTAVHAWVNPRILAAAALSGGAPLDQLSAASAAPSARSKKRQNTKEPSP